MGGSATTSLAHQQETKESTNSSTMGVALRVVGGGEGGKEREPEGER